MLGSSANKAELRGGGAFSLFKKKERKKKAGEYTIPVLKNRNYMKVLVVLRLFAELPT